MEHGLVARIGDRVAANARLVVGAPMAFTLLGITALAVSYLLLQEFQRDRLAALNDRIASQEVQLSKYREKLEEAIPKATAAQIEQLTHRLSDTEKALAEVRSRLASLDLTRDPRGLYQDNSIIASAQDAKVDLDKRTVTFPTVTSQILLSNEKLYEFQGWKIVCGGTRVYNTVGYGVAHEFSYSPLNCKIMGNR
jgi:uncharacterized coiled-coil protein SlyX